MYRPSAFDVADPQQQAALVAALAAERPAQLVTLNQVEGRPRLVASFVPMLFDPAAGDFGVLRGHLARPNPQWRDLIEDVDAMVSWTGDDAYVSPSFYATKRESGKVVPTWNYTLVELSGTLTVHDDAAFVRDVVTQLTMRHESRRTEPWAVTDAPSEYVDAMLKAIVGIELVVTRIEAKRKLSQNKNDADIAGVVAGLSSGTPAEAAVAASVRAVR